MVAVEQAQAEPGNLTQQLQAQQISVMALKHTPAERHMQSQAVTCEVITCALRCTVAYKRAGFRQLDTGTCGSRAGVDCGKSGFLR